jgi:hypothetical protein
VGTKKVVVTWCSLCRTSYVHDRVVDGKTLTFGVSGKLYRYVLTMYDHQTKSLWSQVTGEALEGPLKGKRLQMLACTPQVKWKAWRAAFPDTAVLSVDGKEDFPPGRQPETPAEKLQVQLYSPAPVRDADKRAESRAPVLGVRVEESSKAYLLESLRHVPLLQDRIGTTKLLIYYSAPSGATAVYLQPGQGTFHVKEQIIIGNGKRWDALTGRALGAYPDLNAVPHTQALWYGWVGTYPKTAFYS